MVLGFVFQQSLYEGLTLTYRLGLSIVTAIFFFASVAVHELGHSLVAIRIGVPVKRITLFIFGGLAQITREPKSALDQFIIAITEPIVSLTLAVGFGLVWLVSQLLEIRSLVALGAWLGGINLSLALFNLFPGYPMDGVRVLRSTVWEITGDLQKATRFGATLGQVVYLVFIFAGIWQVSTDNWINGLWIAFIGWFLNNAATSSLRQVAIQDLLKGYTAQEVMMTHCQRLSPGLSLQQLVDDHILSSGRRCYLVTQSDQIVGLITVHQVKETPRARWPITTIGQVMIPVDEFI